MQGMYRQVRIQVGWESFSACSSLKVKFHFLLFFFNGRVFLALVEKQEDRGTVVAQGGGKVSLACQKVFYV